jgi:hypothetical protein
MRTLFLLGILVILVVIAVKKPNQTAWDAARDLQEQAKDVIASADPPLVDSLPALSDSTTWKGVKETVAKAADTLKATEAPSPSNKDDINNSPLPAHNWDPSSRTPTVEIAPRPAVSPLPDIQAVPVAPVQLVENLEEPKIPPLPRVRDPANSNYADVKVYYEQANRFLDKIK